MSSPEEPSLPPGKIIGSDYDLVVVGTGAAGLTAALHSFPLKTLVITKTGSLPSGSTPWAQGGISFPVDAEDIPFHIEDTLKSGAGLCRPEAVDVLIREAPLAQGWLEALGYPFDREPVDRPSTSPLPPKGFLLRGREGGHGKPRILHSGGDSSGKALSTTLLAKCAQVSNITLASGVVALEILTQTLGTDLKNLQTDSTLGTDLKTPQVSGLRIWSKATGEKILNTPRIILAGGGIGQLFGMTTNPPSATGDTLALGMEVGAEAELLEMVQFHPTGLDVPGKDHFPLLSEALRGAGARLVLEDGSDLKVDHPLGILGTRDAVARAVYSSLQKGQKVYMDAREHPGPNFTLKFPSVFRICKEAGLNPLTDLLPIIPVVHYHMGGLKTNLEGQTSVKGLWAVGECASSGVHGANRLASNSLLECLVFGRRAGIDAARMEASLVPAHKEKSASPQAKNMSEKALGGLKGKLKEYRTQIQKIVFGAAGPLRQKDKILGAIEALKSLKIEVLESIKSLPSGYLEKESRELKSFLTLGIPLLQSAADRSQSVGAHWMVGEPFEGGVSSPVT